MTAQNKTDPKTTQKTNTTANPKVDTTDNNIQRVATRDKINVKLTTDEIRDRAMLLPRLMAEVDAAEDEAKEVTKEHKKRINSFKSNLKAMRTVVDSGEEFREVECERVFNLEKGITWLEFNGHKYLTRSATDKELELVRHGSIFDETFTTPPSDPKTEAKDKTQSATAQPPVSKPSPASSVKPPSVTQAAPVSTNNDGFEF